jgi:hypothetical protein
VCFSNVVGSVLHHWNGSPFAPVFCFLNFWDEFHSNKLVALGVDSAKLEWMLSLCSGSVVECLLLGLRSCNQTEYIADTIITLFTLSIKQDPYIGPGLLRIVMSYFIPYVRVVTNLLRGAITRRFITAFTISY